MPPDTGIDFASCSNKDIPTDDEFTYDDMTYTILWIARAGMARRGELDLALAPRFATNPFVGFKLCAGAAGLDFSAAAIDSWDREKWFGVDGRALTWTDADLIWWFPDEGKDEPCRVVSGAKLNGALQPIRVLLRVVVLTAQLGADLQGDAGAQDDDPDNPFVQTCLRLANAMRDTTDPHDPAFDCRLFRNSRSVGCLKTVSAGFIRYETTDESVYDRIQPRFIFPAIGSSFFS